MTRKGLKKSLEAIFAVGLPKLPITEATKRPFRHRRRHTKAATTSPEAIAENGRRSLARARRRELKAAFNAELDKYHAQMWQWAVGMQATYGSHSTEWYLQALLYHSTDSSKTTRRVS